MDWCIIILEQSFGEFSVTIILLNWFFSVLVIISPPAFINSEVIPSTPCDFLLASCFIEYLTSCSVIGGMFSLLHLLSQILAEHFRRI